MTTNSVGVPSAPGLVVHFFGSYHSSKKPFLLLIAFVADFGRVMIAPGIPALDFVSLTCHVPSSERVTVRPSAVVASTSTARTGPSPTVAAVSAASIQADFAMFPTSLEPEQNLGAGGGESTRLDRGEGGTEDLRKSRGIRMSRPGI